MKNSEQAAAECETKKKLTRIKEEKTGTRSEIKDQIDQLISNTKTVTDEIENNTSDLVYLTTKGLSYYPEHTVAVIK